MRVNSYLLRKMIIEEIEREQTGIVLNENKRYKRLFLTEEDLERSGASIEAPENDDEALSQIITPQAREELEKEKLKNSATKLSNATKSDEKNLSSSLKNAAINTGKEIATKTALKVTVGKFLDLIKNVPALGSVVALGDFFVDLILAVKDLNTFTKSLLDVSRVKLSGVRSILGEYSILDASAEDIKKVAVGLSQNMTEEERIRLNDEYRDVMGRFKETVVNLLMAAKEVTFGLGFVASWTVQLLPVELAFKEFMIRMAKIYSKQSKEIKFFIRLAQMFFTYGTWIIPIFGFFSDIERIAAFAEIDDIITKSPDSGRELGLHTIKRGAGKIAAHAIEKMPADKAAKAIAFAAKALDESKTNCRINLLENELKTLNRSFVLVKARR